MTTPPVIAVAALLAVLAVAVAFRPGERRLGHGSFQERRSRRNRRWFPGSNRSLRRRSPRRRRRSPLLGLPAHSSGSPIVASSDGRSTHRGSAGPIATSTAATASNAGLGRSSATGLGHATPFNVGSDLGSGQGSGSSSLLDTGSAAGQAGRPRWPEVPERAGRRSAGPLGRVLVRISMPGRAAARRREMEEAVPEVVDVLRATVAAGINPRRALQAAAEGAPSALSDVLGQAIRAAELGSGAGQALAAAAKAERLSELELAGEALDLAETTGAPPGPVLAGVAIAATDRVRSRQAVLAATAQARLSARVVAAMAPAFLGVLALTSPSDAAFLIREPAGWATLTAATVLELLGISWAAHIVRGPAP
jgi:hypothetical protein